MAPISMTGVSSNVTATDDKQVLIGLDLSAAFDIVDQRLLLDHLRLEFGVTEIPLRWLQSYIRGWTQFIKMGQHESHATEVDVGVPARVCAWPSVVCSLLQPNRRRHHSPRHTVSPILAAFV